MNLIKRISLIVLSLLLTVATNAQIAKDIFVANDYKFVWLGIDYSQVKLIGDFSQFGGAGTPGISEIKNKYFEAWNALVVNEPKKYHLADAFRKGEIQYDLEMVTARNSNTSLESIEALNAPFYTKEKIESIVQSYPLEGKSGIGVIFIAEALNKSLVEAYYHVVIINLATKEILIQERLRGKPAGIGLRNYWAGSVYDVIKLIESSKYKQWKSKYGK